MKKPSPILTNYSARHVARLFVGDALGAGATITLDEAQAHYLTRVMRLGVGARVFVFNGRDGEMAGEIVSTGKKSVQLDLLEVTRTQTPPPRLGLAFAPVKKSANDFIIEKATELGAGILQPVMTDHTDVKPSRVNTKRMRAQAIEAAEQTGRLTIPEIRAPITLADMLAAWDEARHIVFCDESLAAETRKGNTMLKQTAAMDGDNTTILIGPEGGFSQAERDMLRAMPCVHAITLGGNILRADTAAIAALAIFQAAHGAWQ